MKILITDICGRPYDEMSIKYDSLGGAETWTINLAKILQYKGHDVTVLNSCGYNYYRVMPSGVKYIDVGYAGAMLEHYDVAIFSRQFDVDMVNAFNDREWADNIFIMQHLIYVENFTELRGRLNFGINNLRSIVGPTDVVKNHLGNANNITVPIFSIPNGLDIDTIKNAPSSVRDNCMLWASTEDRDFYTVLNIGRKIKESIPDFKIYWSTYKAVNEDMTVIINDNTDILEYIGGLSKKELYAEMKKHKFFIYTSQGIETQCMTVQEQILCGSMPVVYMIDGTEYTLSPYLGFSVENMGISGFDTQEDPDGLFYELRGVSPEKYGEYIDTYAGICVNVINNYDTFRMKAMRDSMYKYIETYYSWDSIGDAWISLFNNFVR